MIKNFNIFESINIKPINGEIYVTRDLSYAYAYASGYKSSAGPGMTKLKNGVIFVIWLGDDILHYGGDVWKSGYENEIKNDLKDYKENDESSRLLNELFELAQIEPTDEQIDKMLKNPVENLLQLISPSDWSYFQEKDMGYSEVVLKKVEWNQIIEIRLYKNFELKIIKGGSDKDMGDIYEEDYDHVFYHGSPLSIWEGKL